ncbi:hypothetical protein ACOSQ3_028964 [Xanthoceras sorbifolium]
MKFGDSFSVSDQNVMFGVWLRATSPLRGQNWGVCGDQSTMGGVIPSPVLPPGETDIARGLEIDNSDGANKSFSSSPPIQNSSLPTDEVCEGKATPSLKTQQKKGLNVGETLFSSGAGDPELLQSIKDSAPPNPADMVGCSTGIVGNKSQVLGAHVLIASDARRDSVHDPMYENVNITASTKGKDIIEEAEVVVSIFSRFHYEECWAESEECGQIVNYAWSGFAGSRRDMPAVTFFNSSCAQQLGQWNSSNRAALCHGIRENCDMLQSMTSASPLYPWQ